MHFFYAFILTIINSIWQSAVLLLLYYVVTSFYKNIHPLQKRNLLYLSLAVQMVLSVFTFVALKYNLAWNNSIIIPSSMVNNFVGDNATTLCYIYCSVVLLKIGTIGFQWSSFYFTYKKYTAKPTAALRLYTSTHATLLGITKKITLLYSTAISTPITFGFFKPVILLPFALCTQMQIKDVEAIILHELAHIKNNDYILNWLLVFVEIIFVCNPFVFIIIKNIKLEREKNCDITVIDFKYDKLSYAETLLQIAKNTNSVKNFQLAFVKNGEQLLQRISFFCNSNNLVFSKRKRMFSFILMLPLLFILCLPSLQKQKVFTKNNKATIANNITAYTEKYTAIKTEAIKREITNEKIAIEKVKEKINDAIAVQNEKRDIVENIYFDAPMNSDFKFVSLVDTLQNTKEFIYNIETAEGKITNTYILKFENGKWILIPTYLIIQKYNDSNYKLRLDSTYAIMDTLIQ